MNPVNPSKIFSPALLLDPYLSLSLFSSHSHHTSPFLFSTRAQSLLAAQPFNSLLNTCVQPHSTSHRLLTLPKRYILFAMDEHSFVQTLEHVLTRSYPFRELVYIPTKLTEPLQRTPMSLNRLPPNSGRNTSRTRSRFLSLSTSFDNTATRMYDSLLRLRRAR